MVSCNSIKISMWQRQVRGTHIDPFFVMQLTVVESLRSSMCVLCWSSWHGWCTPISTKLRPVR